MPSHLRHAHPEVASGVAVAEELVEVSLDMYKISLNVVQTIPVIRNSFGPLHLLPYM